MSHANKSYFSYIRVSTTRQGQTGTSLIEQREAIRRYAERFSLSILKEYEEQETAAKRGRPVFTEMLKALRSGRAVGVIIHKIDRSARNLKDWADLGELIDSGVEVHFANESLDLQSRGGRLSADIQAVVAADYIRNLREETKKGFYGRIKQGLYPMPARAGYLDSGKGLPKIPDPIQAPLVKDTFELYGTGKWGLDALVEEMYARGLRNKRGGKVSRNGLSTILNNPFYTGLIRVKTTGEMFEGKHEPIIQQHLFKRVQGILRGKTVEKRHRHSFLFRRHLVCSHCAKTLIPEQKKDWIYYRCHVKPCPQKTIREEIVEGSFLDSLKLLRFNEYEFEYLSNDNANSSRHEEERIEAQTKNLRLQEDQTKERLSRLTDAFLDGTVERDLFLQKKNRLLMEEQAIKDKLTHVEGFERSVRENVAELLELANLAYLSYKEGLFEEKRDLVKATTSNFMVEYKKVMVKLFYPFQLVAERQKITCGSPKRDVARNLSGLISQLRDYFITTDTPIQFLSSKRLSGFDIKR